MQPSSQVVWHSFFCKPAGRSDGCKLNREESSPVGTSIALASYCVYVLHIMTELLASSETGKLTEARVEEMTARDLQSEGIQPRQGPSRSRLPGHFPP